MDEQELGMAPLGAEHAGECASKLSFESQVRMISVLQEAFAIHGASAGFQLYLARTLVMDDDLRSRILQALGTDERKALVSDQTLYALSRLAISTGAESQDAVSASDELVATRLVLAGAGLTMNSEEIETGEPGNFDPVDVLLQMSGLSAAEPFPIAFGRSSRIFREIAASREAEGRDDFCPIDEWLVKQDPGIGVDDQLALGTILFLQQLEARSRTEEYLAPMIWSQKSMRQLSKQLAIDSDWLIENATADREWFGARFQELESALELDTNAALRGWNRIPLDERPFVRLGEDQLALWSPRSLVNWLTEGLYFRIREAAPTDRDRGRFERFYGWLYEEHCRRLVEETFRTSVLGGVGRVVPPFKYARNQIESPDLILDFGTDLVLVEVCSGRLNLSARLKGETGVVAENLERIVTGKAKQLGRRISDYLAEKYEIVDVDRSTVQRIWPVLVIGGPMMLNEIIGEAIEASLATSFREPQVQRLNILGPGDLDLAMALVESGQSLLRLLETRVGGHQWSDFRFFVSDSPFLPEASLSACSRKAAESALTMIAERTGLDMR